MGAEDKRDFKLKNDGVVTIATGRSRKERKWNNIVVQWSKLLEKLSTTTYTAETFEEYKKLPKDEQDNIKDVGGFVGGCL